MENNSTTRKYALVTGASRGIGRAVSIGLAGMGYHVLINYSSNTAAAEETLRLVREAGSDATLMPKVSTVSFCPSRYRMLVAVSPMANGSGSRASSVCTGASHVGAAARQLHLIGLINTSR